MGLGNPGLRYEGTRHNVGFEAVDRIARSCGIAIQQRIAHSFVGLGRIASEETVLAKPQTYMNHSGNAAFSLLSHYQQDASGLIVIHDDLDLDPGRIRIKRKGGHGGHRGTQSILSSLGTDRFTRLKIGIGRPEGDAEDYVLSPFKRNEREKINEVLDKIVEVIEWVVKGKIELAINRINA